MAKLFDEILASGVRSGHLPGRTDQARSWFRNAAGRLRSVSEKSLTRQTRDRRAQQPTIGGMYMFYYDAKHKKTLPFWDRFPLVFPIKMTEDGFIGINLHYLPHGLRARLMDALYDLASDDKYDENTRLNVSYQILSSASKYKLFEPCIKRYLWDHVQSSFIYVYPSEWDIALFLPLERFQKSNTRQVHQASRKQLKGR